MSSQVFCEGTAGIKLLERGVVGGGGGWARCLHGGLGVGGRQTKCERKIVSRISSDVAAVEGGGRE